MRISGLVLFGLCAVTIGGAAFAEGNVSDRKKVTSQYYVDEQLKNKQPIMSGTSGKVVMAPTSIDPETGFGTPGEKPIVTTLTGAGNTDLPTVGAVRDALDEKQDKLSGTNGYVVTRGRLEGTDEQLTGNPVYSPTDQYNAARQYSKTNKDGVLQANQANAAIRKGLNEHLTCDTSQGTGPNNTCWLWKIKDEPSSNPDYTSTTSQGGSNS